MLTGRTVLSSDFNLSVRPSVRKGRGWVLVNTPFVTLIFNDGGYGLIEWKQMQQFGVSSFIKFGNPDFVKLAESMGLKGYRIADAAALMPTLKEALAQDVPTVIDCPVDYRENFLFSQKSKTLDCLIAAKEQ